MTWHESWHDNHCAACFPSYVLHPFTKDKPKAYYCSLLLLFGWFGKSFWLNNNDHMGGGAVSSHGRDDKSNAWDLLWGDHCARLPLLHQAIEGARGHSPMCHRRPAPRVQQVQEDRRRTSPCPARLFTFTLVKRWILAGTTLSWVNQPEWILFD